MIEEQIQKQIEEQQDHISQNQVEQIQEVHYVEHCKQCKEKEVLESKIRDLEAKLRKYEFSAKDTATAGSQRS